MRAEDTRRKAGYRGLLVLCVFSVYAVIGASAATWYADNGLGNNAFDGTSQVITNGHGPKRNIANALAAAGSSDTVSVATGYYQESVWTPGTKTLTFPSGPVTLVNYDPGQTDTDGDGIPDWWRLWYYGTTTTNSFSCASCVDTNPWAHGLTNLQVYQNPSVLIADNYSTVSDGIPDWWKITYGLSITATNVASSDLDGDGYSNFDEFLMGTDPSTTNDPITVYVDTANTNGVWDGTQTHPFRYIQDAIECSVPVTSNLAVRVRPGNYYETVSNQHYDFYGDVLTSRKYLYIYAANTNWSLSTDPESHIIDSSGSPTGDMLANPTFGPASAIEFFDVNQARINGFTIRDGAGPYGGGILAYSSTNGPIYISNCIVEKNGGTGASEAGGIFLQAGTNSLIYNTVVAKNAGAAGGIIDIYGSRIWNCTVVSNISVQTDVGAISGDVGMPNVRNCAVWGNGLDLTFVDADYSTFDSNEFVSAGTHNLSVDPILVNTADGNYRLQTNSTVRGMGTSLPIEQRDLYGNARTVTGSFDIGANQYKDSLSSGMQDDWEIKNGLSLSVNQGASDFDGDGLSNLQEYNLNTNPNNPDTDGDKICDGPTVPLGSGLQPGPDPAPTTPDLIITAEFHASQRQAVWQYYVDGATDPSWVNEPPTQPRWLKFKNYHIGDRFNIQMKYLSGPTNDSMFFLVPLQSVGAFSVLPDVNATPLLHFTDSAPLGQLTPLGGWTTTVWQATLTNTAGTCPGGGGFDDETPKLHPYSTSWLSVPQSGSNNVTVSINPTNVFPQVIFNSSIPSAASVSPGQATSQTQVVQVVSAGIISNVPPVLSVKGYGAQNSYTTTCATVALAILPKATNVTVQIYVVTAQGEPSTAPTNAPTQAGLSNYLNQVYGQQANVFMTVLPSTNIVVNYDLNGNGVLDVPATGLSPEQNAITAAASKAGAINVYYVHALSNALVEGITYGMYTNKTTTITFIQDVHDSSTINVTAHEIGHALGLEHPEFYGEPTSLTTDRLMRTTDVGGNPCRLIEREWITVSGIAK